ncbi:MAG: cupin domain-containing protein [Saccharofermentanales bacterium]|jgi:glyoxylate utilization-related uncharacterized protein
MIKRELKECKPYDPPKHFKMAAIRLQGKDESGCQKFWMGMSHFLPGGGAEYDYEDSPTEKIYFCKSGEITIYTKDDQEKIVLRENDSIYIPPFEGRRMINETNEPATCIVVVNYPNA